MSWIHILPKHEAIQAMTPDQLNDAATSAETAISEIADGISGLGSLLASAVCGNHGLDNDALMGVGFMLQTLGNLINGLGDSRDAIRQRQLDIEIQSAFPYAGGAQ